MKALGFLRGIAIYLLGAVFFFILFVFAYFVVFTQVTANPGQVKQALDNSGVYQRIPAVIYDNSVDSNATTSASIPLKSPVVRQAAIDAFSPAFVQKSMDSIIDGTYGWLDGKTDKPQFSVNLKDAKANFAKSLSDRLDKLPMCSKEQQAKLQRFDPFSTPCLPASVNLAAFKKQVYEQTVNSDNFLKDTKIDASTIKGDDGKPVFSEFSEIPKTYQAALKVPYLAALACLLLAVGLVYGSRTRRQGLTKVAKILVAGGFFVALLPLAINHLIENILKSSADDKVASDIIGPIVHELSRATSKVYFVVGAIYVLLAIVIFLLAEKLKPAAVAKNRGKHEVHAGK